MGDWLNSVFTSTCYVLFCIMFADTFAEGRKSIRGWRRCLLLTGAIVLMTSVCICLNPWVLLKQVFVILSAYGTMLICFRENPGRILLFELLYHSMSAVLDFVSLQIITLASRQLEEELLQLPAFATLWVVLSQLLVFLSLILVKWVFARRTSLNLTWQEWMKLIAFSVFSIISLIEMFVQFGVVQNGMQRRVFLFLAIGLLVMNVLCFSLIQDISVRENQLQEERLYREQIKRETERYRSISEQYVMQQRREHEYKNQITCIAALIRNGKYQELQSYIEHLNRDILSQMDYIDTNHVIVNAILNTKFQEMKEKEIAFEPRFNNLSDVDMKDEDLVVILSNLLNNAMEACEKCDEKLVQFKFLSNEDWITISTVNSYAVEPNRVGDKFQTSKTDGSALHGIGIENIKEAVDKYRGISLIDYEDNTFRFIIRIPRKKSA